MKAPRRLIEDCCGWNKKTWADALEFAIASVPDRLDGKRVLEIGGSRYSCLAPIFSGHGAEVFCSFYLGREEELDDSYLRFITRKYRLGDITTLTLDAHQIQGTYDIIVMKSVLGGLARGDDYRALGAVVERLFGHVSEDGIILTVDNGNVRLFSNLRRCLGAGRNGWTYVDRHEFARALTDYAVDMKGFGFLNFGSPSLRLRKTSELANTILYPLDKLFMTLFRIDNRAVVATVIRRPPRKAQRGTERQLVALEEEPASSSNR